MTPSTVFYVHWSPQHQQWVGTSPDRPYIYVSCSTPATALHDIRALVSDG